MSELEAMSPIKADSCNQLEDKVRQIVDIAAKTSADANERYDVLTKHGELQGAVARWYD